MITTATLIVGAIITIGLFAVITIARGGSLRDVTNWGVLKGIAMAIIVSILLSYLAGCSTIRDRLSGYAGIETMSADRRSLYCDSDGGDNRTTSNLGLRYQVMRIYGVTANVKYTHHSCVFSRDNGSYDAVGVELEYGR